MQTQSLTSMSQAELIAMIAKMQAAPARKLTMKVTAPKLDPKSGEMKGTSGAISLYGMGKFPITLYRGQWERLLNAADEIKAFIEVNASLLNVKA